MVASFMYKAGNKSYVRLPGSGSDKGVGISFCDLSLGSNLAASVPVPQYVGMPRYLTNKVSPSPVTSTTRNKRPRTEDDSAETNEFIKRPHLDNTDQNDAPIDLTFKPATVFTDQVAVSSQEVSSTVPTTVITNNEPATAPTTVITNNEHVNTSKTSSNLVTINNTQYDVSKLREENNQLRSENANLQKQLTLFKQLMKNPQRLNSVLQRLNERALINPAV